MSIDAPPWQDAEEPAISPPAPPSEPKEFDGFISYSTETDKLLAAKIQDGLERLAKPWRKRKALNIFRDTQDLAPGSDLPATLKSALTDTRTLVLLASPESAASPWCDDELRYWLANRPADEFVVVLTGGTLEFDKESSPPVRPGSTAAPRAFELLEAVPLYIDMRYSPEEIEQLDFRTHTDFRLKLTKISARLHTNKTGQLHRPRDIDSADKREFQKARRLRRIAVILLALLTVAALVAALIAVEQRDTAVQRANEAESRALAGDSVANIIEERDLAALLALESLRTENTLDARGALVTLLGVPNRFVTRSAEHSVPVTAIEFSGDGTLAATGDTSGKVVIWDVGDGSGVPAPRHVLPEAMPAGVAQFVFDDAAGEVGVVATDSVVRWFDLETGEVEDEIISPIAGSAGSATLSPDLEYLVAAFESGEIEVIDGEFDDAVDPIARPGILTAPVFTPDSETLVWAEFDDQGSPVLVRWDWLDESDPVVLTDFDSDVVTVTVDGSGEFAVVGTVEGNVFVIGLTAGDRFELLPRPTSPTTAIRVGPEDPASEGTVFLVSTHKNGDVNLWAARADGGFLLETMYGHNEVINSVAFGEGLQMASGDFGGDVIWWSAVPSVALGFPALGEHTTEQHDIDVADVGFVGDSVISLDDAGNALQFVPTGAEVVRLTPESGLVTAIDTADDRIALGSAVGVVAVLDEMGQPMAEPLIGVHEARVDHLEFSPDRTLVASADQESVVALWDVETDDVTVVDVPAAEVVLAMSDTTLWIGGGNENGPVLFSLDLLTEVVVELDTAPSGAPGDSVTALGLSADGSLLAVGASDRRIWLYETETGTRRTPAFVGHRDDLTGLEFIEDDETLIASDRDGAVRLWDVSERRPIGVLGGPQDGVSAIDVSEDGTRLVAASEDDTVHAWILSPDEWLRRACVLAGRNMTEAEWDRYGRGDYVRHCPDYGDAAVAVAEYDTERLTD